MKPLFFLFFLASSLPSYSFSLIPSESSISTEYSLKESGKDLSTAMNWLLKSSYTQFSSPAVWAYLGASLPVMAYSFHHDKKIYQKYINHTQSSADKINESLAIISTFPFLNYGFYHYGKKNKDLKMIQFSLELFATTYLASLESMLISFIHIHDRPDSSNLNFFETTFRGSSSFTSGHVVPMMALTLKTYQFYGPLASIIPLSLAIWHGKERVVNRKHYLSDITGAFILTAMASEGVRVQAKGYQYAHPLYKLFFGKNHQVRLQIQHGHKALAFHYSY